jgi:hypothetical protein
MVAHSIIHEIMKWATISTTVGSALAGVYHFGMKAWAWLMAPRTIIMALATNHFPHIQAVLKEHTDTMASMQSDLRVLDTKVSGYSQRLDETKAAVDNLTTEFIGHLEKAPHASGV